MLPGATLDAAPRELTAPPPAANALIRRLVEEAAAEAYARGRHDGAEAAADVVREATTRIAAALDAAVAEARALREARARADVWLARAIAEAVLGREPHDGGEVLLERLTNALARIDDRPLTVSLSPGDVEALAPAVGGLDLEHVNVSSDPSLAPGEARVAGPWARAELTRAAAWAAVDAVLGGAGDA